ncbi:hypothetical protein HJG54_04985 [Leptolyngbya sp. NK1-12]|uniref:Uncharacterized protein n=1 Tax=Leptolyngbya sp. NK1-12 TaxID=2547451 RepID=A0AA96WCZ2_9CYAN|nr:hypothetical protein [Leptolyngbya sp. NK1-12]WNZ22280.1 hypothetical protein HJG54_04985 [Leptolyngbya sp. NK1-12]
MKRSIDWVLIPTALAATLAITTVAAADTVQTPLASAVTVSGSSGQNQSQCGFNTGSPTQVIVVNQPTPLRFKVQSQGQPTLWITGPVERCVMADGSAGGNIEVPGVWQPGTYSVYVGNQIQGGQPYTLSIIPE